MPMTRQPLLLVALALLVSAGFSASSAADRSAGEKVAGIERQNERQPLYVSFARLAVNPTRYRGKDIQLVGYLSAAFEDTAVYATHDAYEYGVTTDSVVPLLDEQEFAIARKLHGRFVLVRAVLSDANDDHSYSPIGTMRSLIRLREIGRAP
jgi:hypothetical protein